MSRTLHKRGWNSSHSPLSGTPQGGLRVRTGAWQAGGQAPGTGPAPSPASSRMAVTVKWDAQAKAQPSPSPAAPRFRCCALRGTPSSALLLGGSQSQLPWAPRSRPQGHGAPRMPGSEQGVAEQGVAGETAPFWSHTGCPGRMWVSGVDSHSLRTRHSRAQAGSLSHGCLTLPAALGVRGSWPFPQRETEAPGVGLSSCWEQAVSTQAGPRGLSS